MQNTSGNTGEISKRPVSKIKLQGRLAMVIKRIGTDKGFHRKSICFYRHMCSGMSHPDSCQHSMQQIISKNHNPWLYLGSKVWVCCQQRYDKQRLLVLQGFRRGARGRECTTSTGPCQTFKTASSLEPTTRSAVHIQHRIVSIVQSAFYVSMILVLLLWL